MTDTTSKWVPAAPRPTRRLANPQASDVVDEVGDEADAVVDQDLEVDEDVDQDIALEEDDFCPANVVFARALRIDQGSIVRQE